MPFQIRRGGPLAPKYFLLGFNGTPHPLGCYVCMYTDLRVQCRTQATSLGTCCTCNTLNWSACLVRTGYVFFGTLHVVCKVMDCVCCVYSIYLCWHVVYELELVYCCFSRTYRRSFCKRVFITWWWVGERSKKEGEREIIVKRAEWGGVGWYMCMCVYMKCIQLSEPHLLICI